MVDSKKAFDCHTISCGMLDVDYLTYLLDTDYPPRLVELFAIIPVELMDYLSRTRSHVLTDCSDLAVSIQVMLHILNKFNGFRAIRNLPTHSTF